MKLHSKTGPTRSILAATVACLFFLACSLPVIALAQSKNNPNEITPVGRRPIPMEWKIAALLVVVASSGIGLYFAIRAWRASNLFDRLYYFSPIPNAPLRLGATKSGGCLATIQFGPGAASPESVTTQKSEETPPR